ncbi:MULTISPECIES: SulA-like leucine-rich domain-containing protein [Rheinheimera]|uniref:SulA-like leucine-rich domain-containing protein n=1 Tax=Rheinheimera TaxID=67575 RepID=UPI001E2D3D3B|nr:MULTISPECIES: SulA-like leucine-rich domain-containing protein [Rheinheimera]MCD1598501.1 hypothetical protein [Rheinheimera aquimaris]
MYNNVLRRSLFQSTADRDSCVLQTLVNAGINADSSSLLPRQSLLQLIKQHQSQDGWILLVAPSSLPDKEWAENYQLSLHNVLVVHQKQISDLAATLTQALTSASCKVVINFGKPLKQQQLEQCRKLAAKNNICFYQSEPIAQTVFTH